MRILGLPFLLLLSLPLLAATRITTQIHDVDHGLPGDDVLVFLKSGDVAKTTESHLKLIESFTEAKSNDQWFTLTLDENRNITRVEPAERPYRQSSLDKAMMDEFNNQPYTPTTIESMSKARQYISEGRIPTKEETQCFNRAMVWTYEWWRNHSLRSQKVFVFWPKDYVRKYGFKWWFHVAPYAHVMDSDGKVKERVLDVKWISRPIEFQDWADYHSVRDVKCQVVEKYSDYANYPWGADRCYFIRTHMYTWQPADLELYEAWPNFSKGAFNMDEVRGAYLEAFDIRL